MNVSFLLCLAVNKGKVIKFTGCSTLVFKAVTKSGTGTWDVVGRGDVGQGDVGTRGSGDVGTRGLQNSETRCWRNSSKAGGLKRRGQPWRTILVSKSFLVNPVEHRAENNGRSPDNVRPD